MVKPSECDTLSKILGSELSCRDTCSVAENPSRVYDSIRDGCLIAHIGLTLIEMQRLAFCFKSSLYRLFTINTLSRSVEQDKDRFWAILLTISLLHDIGKLTDQYIDKHTTKSHILHHQISAIVAKRALNRVFDDYISLEVAYAILFHHEAIDWSSIERNLFSFSYFQKVLPSTKRFTYTIDQNRLNRFNQNLSKLIDQFYQKNFITGLQHQTLTQIIPFITSALITNQEIDCIYEELEGRKIQHPKYLTPALALYRLLYLADNRAASARSQYWLDSLQHVDWNRLE
ncbi:MAG: HD domain-containing protein, partial [Nitrososphaerales archaeon]|nr:HD domain-containing protein [Nitrososphaerales archaeon]